MRCASSAPGKTKHRRGAPPAPRRSPTAVRKKEGRPLPDVWTPPRVPCTRLCLYILLREVRVTPCRARHVSVVRAESLVTATVYGAVRVTDLTELDLSESGPGSRPLWYDAVSQEHKL